MKAQANILVALPSKEKDVKVLATAENFRRVGLFIMEHSASGSESKYEDVDPLGEVSSLAGPVARPPSPVVIKESVAVTVPATSSPIVHGKGKNIRLPPCSPPSSDDEDSLYADPLPGHFVVC